jgi:hypothetical protein
MSQVRPYASNLTALARLKFLHAYWAQVQFGNPATSRPLPIDPVEDPHLRVPPYGRGDLKEEPPPPDLTRLPSVLGGFRVHHRAVEVVCYLPGMHPIGSRWWEDLGAWFIVRGVARSSNPDSPQVHLPLEERDASRILH